MNNSRTHLRRTSRAFLARQVRTAVRYHGVLAGVGLACARFFTFIGIFSITLWSYSVWGSTSSPLSALFIPAVICLILGISLHYFTSSLVKQTHRSIAIKTKQTP